MVKNTKNAADRAEMRAWLGSRTPGMPVEINRDDSLAPGEFRIRGESLELDPDAFARLALADALRGIVPDASGAGG